MDPEIIAGKVKTMTDWIAASFEDGTYVGSIGILVEGTFAVVKNGKVENCDFGVNVEDDEKNTVTNVNAINNAFGISTFSENNWIGFNRAFDNAFGINAFADNNSFKSNSAFGNGFGLAIFNDFNLVLSNIAKNNGFGIFVDGQNNTIKFNTALNNSQDLSDDNTNCDNNLWKYNKFNTRNQSCIR